jgi:hypothetical protein
MKYIAILLLMFPMFAHANTLSKAEEMICVYISLNAGTNYMFKIAGAKMSYDAFVGLPVPTESKEAYMELLRVSANFGYNKAADYLEAVTMIYNVCEGTISK